jgi:antagonist of KipI
MCTVIQPGMLSTVQDQGRQGYRAFGMPSSGVMDRYAATMANILAGNPATAAVLEMTLVGGSFRFASEAYIAIAGADMKACLNGQPLKNWSGVYVPPDSELVFDRAADGCRSYLALHGGIAEPSVLGSGSTYTRAALGGLDGRALRVDDVLRIGRSTALPSAARELPRELVPRYGSDVRLRVILGPQDAAFTTEGLRTLFSGAFKVSPRNDRMGILMEGPTVQHANCADIISDAIAAGAIQVPGDGHPIVMMADCQTTGGYAKIGFVISADLPRLAQARAGDGVSFVESSDEEAVAALAVEERNYARASAG